MSRVERVNRPLWLSWLIHHREVAGDSLRRIARRPLAAILTCAVIGITLALPAGLAVAIQKLADIRGGWEQSISFSLFLKDEVAPQIGQTWASALDNDPRSVRADYLSREQALAEFRANSGFASALELLDDNPLPATIVVWPLPSMDSGALQAWVDKLATDAKVEHAQLDSEWVARLHALMDVGAQVIGLIAGLLAIAVVINVGNTIHLEIQNRKQEIIVMKLIGATNAFIHRPFLYTGLWYGIGGGLMAWIFISVALWQLHPGVTHLAELYGGQVAAPRLPLVMGGQLVAAATVGSWLGSWIAVHRHLRAIEPE